MQNLTPDEVTQLAANGIDIQLHTHRHRTPKDRNLFIREIEDNRQSIQSMIGKYATHFCYPSGVHDPVFLPWLNESGVVSATTCDPGFASITSDRFLLPRVLDNPGAVANRIRKLAYGSIRGPASPARRKSHQPWDRSL